MKLHARGGGGAILPPLFFLLLLPPPALANPRRSALSPYAVEPTRNNNNNDNSNSSEKKVLTLGVIIPGTTFKIRHRAYMKKLYDTIDELKKQKYPPLHFPSIYNIDHPEVVSMKVTPTPTDILNTLCERFLTKNVSAILYITKSEMYGATTVSAQYFLQLAAYLGLPVISWNADNSGFETKLYKSIILQLAPAIEHQSLAMLSILQRYGWHQFSIVTSQIAGHNNFIEAVKGNVHGQYKDFKFSMLSVIRLETSDENILLQQLGELKDTDTRIILLYATRDEAVEIVHAATTLGLTGKDYVWIVTQSIIGKSPSELAPPNFPPGMLGVHFDTSDNSTLEEIENGVKVFGHGLELFINDPRTANVSLQPNLSCSGNGETRWSQGDIFYRFLQNVSISLGGTKYNLEFNPDGTMSYPELEVVNLNQQQRWEKIGIWSRDGLDIKDIVWPGNSHVPPQGFPEKFHLKLTFLEEPPFIHLAPPDPITDKCINRGVQCRVNTEAEWAGMNNGSSATHNGTQCCSGFCVDLMEKFANDIGFTYDLVRVEDGVWGTEINGKWNGLIAALLQHKTDGVVTAFNINSHRESVVDFTVPFMETGISVIVAKRTGIVSPKAFLEPFDTLSWLLILLVSIQVATMAIFLFEWFSPFGYNMKVQAPRDHKFSLFRTYWLVWAILFGASVNVDCPRSYTARYMSNVWAMFAVVFLAIYTANLAAFMITREEYYELTGIEDRLLLNPYSIKPPFRYGTIPFGNTEFILQKNFPAMYSYMKHFNRPTVKEGIKSIKRGELDAFIYDATVLDYLVGQDEECKLLTVGSWYAMTGYGIAFPRNSKHLESFNRLMMDYRENGELERLQRFWMAGVCKPDKQERSSSKPLSFNQFMSAFLLLGCGILFALLLLFLEHLYFKYLRKYLARKDTRGCCGLISLSMGKSLSFREAVYEAQDLLRTHRCQDPLCDTHLWKVKHELDMARLQIRLMERMLHDRGFYSPFPREPYYNTDYVMRTRDLTKVYISSTESRSSPRRREITEIETVL